MSQGPRSLRRTAMLLAAAAMTMSAAACGGSGNATTDSGTNTPAGNNPMSAYIQCLQENGVTITMPSGGPGAGGRGARPSGAGPGGFPSGMPRPSGDAQPGQGFPGGGAMGRPEGVDDETWNKAQSACASVRPSMGAQPGGGTGPGGGANAAYRNCLQENGVTTTEGLTTADPTVAAAMEKCAVLRPEPAASPTA